MTSVVAQVTGAVIAALTQVPAVAPQVARVRLRPWADDVGTAVAVRPVGAQRVLREFSTPGLGVWDVRFGVECYARATSSPDMAVDALLAAVHERLLSDPTLGGAVRDLQPEKLEFDFDADGDQTVAAVFVFTARMTCGTTFT